MPHLAHIALIVRDYNEALAFYVGKLGFTLVEDTTMPDQGKRWVTIRPPGAPYGASTILLARAATPEQARFIGDQAGGRVFLFLATDDLDRDFAAYTAVGVRFVRPPAVRPYGKVAVFEDLYGNRWDLIEFPAEKAVESRPPGALSAPQSSRAAIRFGSRFVMEAETRMTPLGLLAVGGMVATILLAVPRGIRARRGARMLPRS